jgi:hypothetical protein
MFVFPAFKIIVRLSFDDTDTCAEEEICKDEAKNKCSTNEKEIQNRHGTKYVLTCLTDLGGGDPGFAIGSSTDPWNQQDPGRTNPGSRVQVHNPGVSGNGIIIVDPAAGTSLSAGHVSFP